LAYDFFVYNKKIMPNRNKRSSQAELRPENFATAKFSSIFKCHFLPVAKLENGIGK